MTFESASRTSALTRDLPANKAKPFEVRDRGPRFNDAITVKLDTPQTDMLVSQMIGKQKQKQISKEHEDNPNKLSEDKLVREMQELVYSKLGILPETNRNSTKDKFIKGLVDGLLIGNAELAREIYKTNGKVLLDMISSLISLDGLKKIAEALGKSIMDIFSGDAYLTGKSIAELGLITTGSGVVGWGLKKAGKSLLKQSAKVSAKAGTKTLVSKTLNAAGRGAETTGKVVQAPYNAVKGVGEIATKTVRKGTERLLEAAPGVKAVVDKVKSQTGKIVLMEEKIKPNQTSEVLVESRHMTPLQHDAVKSIRDGLKNHPELSTLVEEFLLDSNHKTNLQKYLTNPETRQEVISLLTEMADSGMMDKETYLTNLKKFDNSSHKLFSVPDSEFSLLNGEKKLTQHSNGLLISDRELFGIGYEPNIGQLRKFREFMHNLNTEGLSEFTNDLTAIVGENKDGFTKMNSRIKSPDDVLEKIERMRKGNKDRTARPDYILADVPDIIGGRITVSNIDELEKVTSRLEKHFGKDRIIEKDNFYSNSKKAVNPYRIIAYTVQLESGAMAEIQVSTLLSSIVADIDHNTLYKPHIKTTDSQKELIESLRRHATIKEAEKLQK